MSDHESGANGGGSGQPVGGDDRGARVTMRGDCSAGDAIAGFALTGQGTRPLYTDSRVALYECQGRRNAPCKMARQGGFS